jgi:quercetin dioxygenase-like cupin family protein
MAPYNFDVRNIKWNKLTMPPVGELKHLLFSILSVDEENHIVHVLFKFAANEKIILHRHMIHNNTFVVQGEHRLYEPDGTLKEIRPTGMYKSSPPGDVHREGGGSEQDVIVFFDMRGRDGLFYESSTMTKMLSPRSVTPTSSVLIKRNRMSPDGDGHAGRTAFTAAGRGSMTSAVWL